MSVYVFILPLVCCLQISVYLMQAIKHSSFFKTHKEGESLT